MGTIPTFIKSKTYYRFFIKKNYEIYTVDTNAILTLKVLLSLSCCLDRSILIQNSVK